MPSLEFFYKHCCKHWRAKKDVRKKLHKTPTTLTMKNSLLRSLFLTTALLLSVPSAHAQNNTFVGATTSSWSANSSWSLGTVPTSAQDVFSANGTQVWITSNTTAVAGNLTIGGASGTSEVSLRQATGTTNSLTVSGNITLASGVGNGRLILGIGGGGSGTLTIGGGTGSILNGGGAGTSAIYVYGNVGTLGLANATAEFLDMQIANSTAAVLTIGSGQNYNILTQALVGSATGNITSSLTVNGTLTTPLLSIGLSAASGTNNATLTLNEGGLIRATTLQRAGTQSTTFNWNGGTIQNTSGGNLSVIGSGGNVLTLSLAGTGNHTFNADNGQTITLQTTAVLADQSGQNGTLTKDGLGALTLNSTNTYTGATTINAGTVKIGSAGSLGAGTYSGAITNNGTLQYSSSVDQTLSGNISGTGGLTKDTSSTSTLTLAGSNTYTGTTTVNAGTLAFSVAGNGSSNGGFGSSSNAASNVLIGNGAVLSYNGTGGSTDRLFTINGTANGTVATLNSSGTGAINWTNTGAIAYGTNNQTRTLQLGGTNTGNNTLAALIADNGSGAVSLTKSGAGTWVLTGNNTYTGATTLSGGVLSISTIANATEASNLGAPPNAGSGYLLFQGGTLQYTGSGHSTNRNFNLQTGGATIDASGTGALVMSGGAIANITNITTSLTLTGSNTDNNTLSGALTISNNATLGSLVKNGTGKWVLSGSSTTYNGTTTLNAGTLQIGNANALGTTGNITFGGGMLQYGSGITADLSTRIKNSTSAILVDTNSNNVTYASAIDSTNSGGLTKNGNGTLTLNGTNTYTGTTTVNTGTLATSAADRISDSSAVTVASGAVLQLGGSETVGSIAGAGNYSLGAYTLTAGADNTSTTVSGVLSGAGGGLTKTGTGTLTLSGNNTYTGATTINSGTLSIGAADRIADASNLNVAGGTFNLAGFNEALGSITGSGNITLGAGTLTTNSSSSTTFSGVVSGTGALVKNGTSTLTLAGSNTYTGTTTISSGTLAFSVAGNGSSNGGLGSSSNAASNVLIGNGTVLSYNGTGGSTDRLFTINGTANSTVATLNSSGTGAINWTNTGAIAYGTNNQTRTLQLGGTNSGNNTLAALIADNGSGAVGLTKSGAGTWVLTGNNTYTGATTISGGVLSISTIANATVASNLGAVATTPSGYLVFQGGTLQYTGSGHSTNRSFNMQTGGATIDASGTGALIMNTAVANTANLTTSLTLTGSNTDNNTLSGLSISNNATLGSLVKNGTGKWVLSGINTSYNGTTTLNAGTLQIGNANALGTTGNITFGGGMLQYGSGITADLSSRIKNSGSAILIDTNSNNVTFASAVDSTNSGGLTKNGTGTLTLSAANTYTGTTTVNAGTLQAAATGALANSTVINVNGGSFLVTAENAVNDNAAINLAGGRMAVSGTFNETVGLLTLSANSTIDLAGFTGTLRFGGVGSWAGSFNLDIWNWNGINRNIVFTDAANPNDLTNYLSRISFYSDSGSSFIGNAFEQGFTGAGGGTEIIAVPETETYLYALALLAGVVIQFLRRRAKQKAWEGQPPA